MVPVTADRRGVCYPPIRCRPNGSELGYVEIDENGLGHLAHGRPVGVDRPRFGLCAARKPRVKEGAPKA